MPTVRFSYDQRAVLTCTAKCEVPQAVVDAGDEAIKDYLYEHSCDWDEEDGEVVNTEYGSTCGKSEYAIYREDPKT